jgi:hypothetical protein
MIENGNRYALAALKEKPATLSSEIIQFERQIRYRKDLLVHADATLPMLDPEIEIDSIPNKRLVKHINIFRQGELGQLVRTPCAVLTVNRSAPRKLFPTSFPGEDTVTLPARLSECACARTSPIWLGKEKSRRSATTARRGGY